MFFGRFLLQFYTIGKKWQHWGKEAAHFQNDAKITRMLLDKNLG